jgi:membrane-bound metal-dependent hydrolase YbcI (DUF457 family)
VRGTSHQLASAALGMSAAYAFHPSLEIGAAVTGGMVAAAKGPDQLELRNLLDGVRARKTRRLERQLGRTPTEAERAGIMRWHIRHRGPTHWLRTGILVAGLAWLCSSVIVQTRPLASYIALGVLAGYWSHTLLDMFNLRPVELEKGVEAQSPRPFRCRSGGFVDSVFATVCLGVSVYLAVKLAPTGWQARARGTR